ncbi:pseudouridine synthase [Marivivens aquimaris]
MGGMSNETPEGDRIAKVLSRAGVASRREAERMIAEGRVKVNGKVIESPALNVTDKDRVMIDDVPMAAAEPARLWLYHKPSGLVTTERDEKDRPTVFSALPEDMPRVMSIGRLDLNSEGLLLLTNDGELKRRLELPSTGWLRRYRVRVKGEASKLDLDRLRAGIDVEGVKYQPMQVQFDRQQGANAWLTISIREGKNREIRRAMEAIGAVVNRLIRVSYGPFQIGNLKAGEVEEIKRRVLRDQLGLDGDMQPLEEPKKKPVRTRRNEDAHPKGRIAGGRTVGGKSSAKSGGKPTGGKTFGTKPTDGRPAGGKTFGNKPTDGKPSGGKTFGSKAPDRKLFASRDDAGPSKGPRKFTPKKPR